MKRRHESDRKYGTQATRWRILPGDVHRLENALTTMGACRAVIVRAMTRARAGAERDAHDRASDAYERMREGLAAIIGEE